MVSDAVAVVPEDAGGLVLAGDVERVARYADASRAEATRRAYASDIRSWEAWCRGRGVHPLPADPLHVVAYLTGLADSGASPVTVARRLSGISDAHRVAGHAPPSEHEGIRRVMRGVRRAAVHAGHRPRKARALDTATVRALVEDLPDSPGGTRDRALLLLGYSLGLRASDLIWLDVDDITPATRGGGLDVRIRHSKTDQEGAGETLALAPGTRSGTCPVAAVTAWVGTAGITCGPLFRPVGKNGTVGSTRLTTRSVARVLARAAALADVPVDRLSPHSLRRGFATSAYANGVAEREIARVGRWRSVTVLRGYDDSGRWADPASGHLGL
ncbi:tyrosine-type recombinase/integrase [Knoellia sp. LjRoot47]|uniref:tyrosine-type recombinase/integrase n=1 Tax=Knoellia sp. LjRoot47 TaxID=3342330 RepID=UPI003F4FAEA8